MTKLCYVDKKFTPEVMAVIGIADAIVTEYDQQGLNLTLRQLYYQFVSRDIIPNKQSEYNRLGRIISDARLAGLISWTALEDRGRGLKGYRTFDGPGQAVAQVIREYKIDMWANQPWRPEVWVEKQAMEGVIGQAASEFRVDFFATKGYNSQSEQWRAGRRLQNYIKKGQRPIIFHLADHDPSGFDMTEDLKRRLTMFVGIPVMVQRLALNPAQVQKYNPPPNPAKETDSRFADYREKYGDSSWEMDALEPGVIRAIIREAIDQIRDKTLWDEMAEQEVDDIRVLQMIAEELGGKSTEGNEYE
jgi:hypothetical protein